MRFERKVAGVVEVHFGVRTIASEGLGSGGQEEGIILTPNGKERRPLRREVIMELGMERDITRTIEEQVELDLVVTGPRQGLIVSILFE